MGFSTEVPDGEALAARSRTLTKALNSFLVIKSSCTSGWPRSTVTGAELQKAAEQQRENQREGACEHRADAASDGSSAADGAPAEVGAKQGSLP